MFTHKIKGLPDHQHESAEEAKTCTLQNDPRLQAPSAPEAPKSVMSLTDFAKTVLTNTCAREIRDSRNRDMVVYNSSSIPKEHLEQFYTFDLHCARLDVWVKHHLNGGISILESELRDC